MRSKLKKIKLSKALKLFLRKLEEKKILMLKSVCVSLLTPHYYYCCYWLLLLTSFGTGDQHIPSEKKKSKMTIADRVGLCLSWFRRSFESTTLNEWARHITLAACISYPFLFLFVFCSFFLFPHLSKQSSSLVELPVQAHMMILLLSQLESIACFFSLSLLPFPHFFFFLFFTLIISPQRIIGVMLFPLFWPVIVEVELLRKPILITQNYLLMGVSLLLFVTFFLLIIIISLSNPHILGSQFSPILCFLLISEGSQ